MITIRRPLCAVALLVAAWFAIMLPAGGGGAPTYEALDKEQVAVAGYVDGKEYRMRQEGRGAVVTLSEAVILGEDQISVPEQFLSDSEKIPQHTLHRIWKENKAGWQRADAVGIEGVLCYMADEELPAMGSLVIVRGRYRAFTHATNPGEFDSADYYQIMGQQGRVMDAALVAQSRTHSDFREGLYRLREYVSLLIDACYDETDASVMKAMLLGEKGTLDKDIKALYRQNGILHVLAISGLHLSVIGMGCYAFFKKVRLPEVVDITLTIGLMYGYGMMTGMGVSMLRAYLMFTLHLLAKLIGRTYDLLTAVSVAALVILIGQPLYLGHSGFLFSFGAICGIGVLLPAVQQNLFSRHKAERAVMSGVAVSLATLPVYLHFYYEFPPYSVLLNLMVIPGMTALLLCGLFSVAVAALHLPLGVVMAYPAALLLGLYEKCCALCYALPGSLWRTGAPAFWQTGVFLAILAGLCIRNRRLPKLCFWLGVLCALSVLAYQPSRELQITMLDVGQGDCIYLAGEGGIHMLIDGGSSDRSDVAAYQMTPYLKHEGVTRLDAVVVTHPDNDHISGIRTLLEEAAADGIAIDVLYLPDVGARGRTQEYRALEESAETSGVPVHYLGDGDRLRCGGVLLTCLHPEKGWDSADTNAYSTVLYLTYGNFSALFTGDLEGEGERRVLDVIKNRLDIHDITLLKVAHHGSENSTGEDFLQALSPKLALISAGRGNRYGHPHEALLGRLRESGCQIYRTQESGAVTVRLRGGRVSVSGYLEP